MKKIIFIISALMMSLAMLIVSSPKTYASPTWNNVYIFDAYTQTTNGVTLTIEEGTNVFTVNGTSTGTITTFDLPTLLYALNTNGSQLDETKTYMLWYEYISGSATSASAAVTVFDTGVKDDHVRSLTVKSADYQIDKGYVIHPNGASMARVSIASGGGAVNLTYKLHFIEITTLLNNQYNLVNSTSSISNGSLTLSFEDENTLILNGTVSNATSISMDSVINPELQETGKIFVVAFEYISGSINSTYARTNPISVNSIFSVIKATSSLATSNAFAVESITSLVAGTTQAETLTNFKYKIYVQEVELYSESSTPGESTTPPTGLSLSGSFYEGRLYYNTAVNSFSTHPAVYLATTTGDTFDLNILTENLVFTSTDENIRFYIGRISGGEENIAGTDDFIISKDATFLTIARHIDGTLYDSIHAPLYDVDYIMIEYGTAAAETYSVVFNSNGGSSVVTQTVLEGNLAQYHLHQRDQVMTSLSGALWELDLLIISMHL